MASSKLSVYSPLPAPAILSVPQSKSHVLAGVQDAYWSDEEEDQECPLCLEEMDISDLNFKPCVCGYQICRFCWHHIKENLNKRCPACRRVYTDEGVEFKPVATQDHKRLTQQKKQRDREKKELETLGRKHLANVRVVQRNVVYVVGIGPRFAKEELIPTLRSNEYFGQYGKISKILLVKRTAPGGGGPVVGLYITYTRREDAARAISAVDGAASPGGGRDIMRASYGTTKYCMAFLRNQTCNDHNCMNLHEWGDEKDCFTKEDLTTLKHTMKATETRAKTTIVTKKEGEDASLPRAASWGQKSNVPVPSTATYSTPSSSSLIRQTRRMNAPRQTTRGSTASATTAETKPALVRTASERKAIAVAKAESSVSRPSTPAVPSVAIAARPSAPASPAAEPKPAKAKKEKEKPPSPLVRETNSPAPSQAAESDASSAPQELPAPSQPSRPASTESMKSPALPPPPAVPVPAVPPGLFAPPGIPSPVRPPRHATDSPQTPLLSSQSSYQMSNAARALLDDVKARRESYVPAVAIGAPFPEFDRTLQTLSGDDGGGFSFNLDPKLADQADATDVLPELEMEANTPFHGSYTDAFPALRPNSQLPAPPGLGYPRSSSRSIFDPVPNRGLGASPGPMIDRHSNYMGSFNPFQDGAEASGHPQSENTHPHTPPPAPSSPFAPFDEERKVSRFGFARGRQSASVASSPLNGSSIVPLSDTNTLHSSLVDHAPPPGLSHLRQWDAQRSDSAYSQPPSMINSPQLSSQLPYNHNLQPQPSFRPFDNEVSEMTLRDFIMASREREHQKTANDTHLGGYKSNHPFQDPAIMSASFGPVQTHDMSFNSMAYGPPPGLGGVSNQQLNSHPSGIPGIPESNPAVTTTSTSSPAPSLSAVDFPALVPSTPKEEQSPTKPSASLLSKAQEKAARKAAKQAASAEKAAAKAKAAADKAATVTAAPVPQNTSKGTIPSSPSVSTSDSKGSTSASKAQVSQAKPKGDSKVTAGEGLKEVKPSRKEEKAQKAPAPKAAKNPPPTPKQPKAPAPHPIPVPELEPEEQAPILSRKSKKNKPIPVKVPKTPKEDDLQQHHDCQRSGQSTEHSATPNIQSKPRTPSKSPDPRTRLTLEELLEEISRIHPGMDLISHPFFDLQKLSSTAKMPLEYGPLVHALSALSVGGGSFANNVPSGSIDTAVSSFQQLLETLTQTISDLLRLLPRTTWDDSSSFDGVLRDMLKGDDFLDEGGEDGHGKDDEVAALTLALERRARWMEVQLSKLEELHRDINTAAVKAVLSFNDNGWDKHGFLPRLGNTLKRFESIGLTVDEAGNPRAMTADELEKKLVVAKEAAIFAETEAREAMAKMQFVKEFDNEFY
ncbi:hypothetical protein FA13DRAFT_1810578 [Coprinellus micaceus]|uniref:RING-type domain-containing protein n=1 Tax=Coprinellus micaceus TaxID=71717 RepID=A0A4Y7TQR4_COPMI|nr:hypothetical protein FA13DRAFT_1810578 [Coprinellus micaceus]